MPISYKIHREQRLVFATVTGPVRFAEIRDYQVGLPKDPEFDPTYHHLIDTSGLTHVQLSDFEFRTASQYRKLFSPNTRHALVAPPLLRWMAGLVQIYHDASFPPSKLELFHDVASALRWLGVEEWSEESAD